MDALLRHAWQGNVRELEHVVERAVLMGEGTEISVDDLFLSARHDGAASFETMTLEEVERHLIQRALARCANVSDAAKALGLSRSALYRRLQHFGLPES
ncbi:MAG: hypothetical protein QOI66_2636 [Myxococcales bacterium]|jgi:DNA-binding NtrC family response regulator|nr:hypothetical protein [Myxococcales bacterium]